MSTRRRAIVGVGSVLVLVVAVGAWMRFNQEPPVEPPNPDERKYEEISRPEYEQWMQSLGYTE